MSHRLKNRRPSRYQPAEFARRTGVTVRTLHHYDRLGLLKPRARTAAGYRLYGEEDVVRLQQIVTLKFIGFPLKRIKQLLDRKGGDLAAALRLQRLSLEEKRRRLDSVIGAIARAEQITAKGRNPGWEVFQKIIEVIQMQTDPNWMMNYYSDEAREAIAERAKSWTPELQAQCEQDWATLQKEVAEASAAGEDPASEKAQALAGRWSKLIEGFTGGNSAVLEGLKKLYADRGNWPSSATYMPKSNPGSDVFIHQALAIREKKTGAKPAKD